MNEIEVRYPVAGRTTHAVVEGEVSALCGLLPSRRWYGVLADHVPVGCKACKNRMAVRKRVDADGEPRT